VSGLSADPDGPPTGDIPPDVPTGLIVEPDAEGVARAAAAVVEREALAAIGARGRFTLALSGGSTPEALYRRLAGEGAERIPWPQVHLFWGDERCVPASDDRSNFRMASLTGLLDLPLAAIHRMPGELDPEEGAEAYGRVLGREGAEGAVPSLDLVLLGLGDDGHTASLFPGSPALDETRRWVVPTGPVGGVRRLSVTLPVFAAAGRLLFVVTGEAKAPSLARVLGENDLAAPAARVASVGRAVTWVVDEAAAGLLSRS
jgi:6-phosphogluconolactonase